MAMQMGLTKALILVGAGYTGSVLVRNGKMSDILGELQVLLRSAEKSGDSSAADSDTTALVSQLERLSREVQRMASARPITVVSGNSGQGGNLSSLVVPAATIGAVGYGYMRWKGFSFSDLMYVTKGSMTNAVSSLTKHLEQVSAALAATKRHLTQRIENLDGKLDEQKEISKDIRKEVTDARGELVNVGNVLSSLQEMVWGLSGRMESIEDKQNFACAGVMYLCKFVSDKGGKVPEFLQDATKGAGKRGFLGYTESTGVKGLQHLTETFETGNFEKFKTPTLSNGDSLDTTKSLSREASIKC